MSAQEGLDRRALLALAATGLAAAAAGRARAEAPAADPAPADAGFRDLVQAPLRDGAKLACSLWLPPGTGPFPAVVMRTLNRRRDADPARSLVTAPLRAAGYAVLAADLRGRFESEGVFDPNDLAGDARDGADLVDWAAAQPWCDGQVGTLGRAPPPTPRVKAAVVWGPAATPPGGPPALIEAVSLLAEAGPEALDRLAARGGDVSAGRAALALLAERPEAVFAHLPLSESPAMTAAPFAAWLAPRLLAPAQPPSAPEVASAPTLRICGWYDPATAARLAGFRGAPGEILIVGPWAQTLTPTRRLAQVDFGPAADPAGAELAARVTTFFDRTLRGRPGAAAPIRYFVMGANAWRETAVWPPAGLARRRLYLRSGGKANSVAGDGVLTADGPGGDPPDRFVYDPDQPAPTMGGAIAGGLPGQMLLGPGPVEQSPLEKRPDVLCYTTAPFPAAQEVTGPVTLRLFVESSAANTDFTGRLTHVYPDGASVNLCEAIQRLDAADPGAAYDLVFDLGQTSVELAAGHRLRLQVTSSNFPQFDRNMNTGHPPGSDAKGVPAVQTVHHRRGKASWLELCVGPPRGALA